MKLDGDSKVIDYDKEEAKKKAAEQEASIYKHIVEECGWDVPIVKFLPKNQHIFNFRGRGDDWDLIKKMCGKSKKFNDTWEVCVAALHLGTMILYHQVLGKTQKYKDKVFYDNIFRLGKLEEDDQMLDSTIEVFDKIIDGKHRKRYNEEAMMVKAERVVLGLPEHLHEEATGIFNEQYQGNSMQTQKRKLLLKGLGGRPPKLKAVK